jgi:uncharacterized protein
MSPLEALLVVQAHDTAVDRLRHRRAALPERVELEASGTALAELAPALAELRRRHDELTAEERRLDDEARSLEARAAAVEKTLYSGEVSSPRELTAMQADVEQLRRHRTRVEERELEVMEARDALDAELAEAEQRAGVVKAESDRLRAELAAQEAVIDGELGAETEAREIGAAGLPAPLVALYERCRAKAHGVGVARLAGSTCQGCHLTIPATEAERIRRQPPDQVSHCDNCGCILVPS